MKILKGFLKLSFVILMLISILFITSKLLEEKIVNKAITILNSQVNVPVYIDNISFSLLKKFPNATLQLNDVTMFSAKGFNRADFTKTNADTLIFIDELYLSLNLPELLNNKLNITKAYIQKGKFNILVDKKGKENFRVFNNDTIVKDSNTNSNKSFMLLLNKIQLKDVTINFINKYKKTSISISAPSYILDGHFYKKSYTVHTKGKMFLNYFEHENIKLHPESPTDIKMDLSVNNNTINIIQGNLENKDYQFKTNGKITLGIPMKIDIKIHGNSTNINKLVEIINSKNTFSTKGQIGISAIIRGILSSKKTPAIAANFKLINGYINNKKTNFNIDSLNIEGSYSNGKSHSISSSTIKIKKFYIVKNKSKISGSLSIINFNKPTIKIKGNTHLCLLDIDNLLASDKSYKLNGYANGNFYCNGTINNLSDDFLKQFAKWRKTGDFKIINGEYIAEKQLSITNITGTLNVRNNYVSITELNSIIQSSNISGNISLNNYLLPIIDDTKPLIINTNINADIIKYTDFEHFFVKTDNDNTSNIEVIFSGKIKANKLLYSNITANNVSAEINYKKNKLNISNLNLNTMGGNVLSEIKFITKSENKTVFQTYISTKDINIKTLFKTFNNFGQTLIKQDNISGYLNTSFNMEMSFINNILKKSSIDFLGHIIINNGQLINFKPIEDVAKFSEIKEMKDIKFSLLETDIMIGNDIINIPKTEIKSNAFDMSLSGIHKFNGDYEYHMKVYLADFIKGKSKTLKQQQSEFGYIKDDGYGKVPLFLLATSKNGVSKVKLDKTEIKNNLKNNLKQEKYEFKKALHDQFGWFKKDTTLKEKKKESKTPDFIIEWDEE